MLKSIKVPMTLVRAGTVVLIIIAFLYVYLGYPYVSKGLFASNLDAGVSGEVRAAYLGFSLHLFFIAYLLLDSSRRSNPRKLIMLLCGLIVFVDSFLVRTFLTKNNLVGQALALSGTLVLLGSFFWFQFQRIQSKAHIQHS
jgi:uncharacterized membrane protein